MSRAVCFAVTFNSLMLAGCASIPSTTAQVDGVYVIPEEVSHYQDDRLELRNGRFRYWHSSDSVVVDEQGRPIGPKYPIKGAFRVDGRRLTFSSEDVGDRYTDTINGHSVLWTLSGKRIWERQHKIYDYSVLIRVVKSGPDIQSPSVRVLYNAATLKKNKEWRDPFVHGPQ